jgi:uncharacterized glyoxalase superfamily protein PhnB
MSQASSIPAGFHSATGYLIFDGTAAEAIAFYDRGLQLTESRLVEHSAVNREI